ncbi:MAG: hypothetical protein ACPGJW_09045 [Paracoccaceae bacterium]
MRILLIRIAVTIAIGFFFVPVAYLLWFGQHGIFGACSDETAFKISQPNGAITAHMFVRGCGATTPLVTHIELEPAQSNVDPQTVYQAEWSKPLLLEWLGDQTLKVSMEQSEHTDVFWQVVRWNDITIEYDLLPTEAPHNTSKSTGSYFGGELGDSIIQRDDE